MVTKTIIYLLKSKISVQINNYNNKTKLSIKKAKNIKKKRKQQIPKSCKK